MRDDYHGVLSALPELQVALGEALLIALAKRLHDLVSPVAVPLTRLSRVPHHITVEDFLDRAEVAFTPSCQALPGDPGRVAAHVTSIRSHFEAAGTPSRVTFPHTCPGEPPGVPTLLETVPFQGSRPLLGSAKALEESVDVGEQQRLAEELLDPG